MLLFLSSKLNLFLYAWDKNLQIRIVFLSRILPHCEEYKNLRTMVWNQYQSSSSCGTSQWCQTKHRLASTTNDSTSGPSLRTQYRKSPRKPRLPVLYALQQHWAQHTIPTFTSDGSLLIPRIHWHTPQNQQTESTEFQGSTMGSSRRARSRDNPFGN